MEAVILGDGNFSFSVSLAELLFRHADSKVALNYLGMDEQPAKLVATSFDSQKEILEKYPESTQLFPRVERLPVEVLHGINACLLEQHFQTRKFRAICWNHPHLGVEDFRLHKSLLSHFFHSARNQLTPDGIVVVALLEGQAERWDIVAQAEQQGLFLQAAGPFMTAAFPGYECKRNKSGQSFKNSQTSKQWRPGIDDEAEMGSTLFTFSQTRQVVEDTRPPKRKRAEKDLPHACDECSKAYSSVQGLKTHKRQVHEMKIYDRSGEVLACKHCDKTFVDQLALSQHTAQKHSGSEATRVAPVLPTAGALCPACQQPMEDDDYAKHLKMFEPVPAEELQCRCGKTFTEQRALQQHQNFCGV